MRGSYLTISAHSGYVGLLINAGAVGLVLFASALIYALAKGLWVLLAPNGDAISNMRLAVAIVAAHAVCLLVERSLFGQAA